MMPRTKDTESPFKINKELLPLKIYYFLFYGACLALAYVSVLLKYLGLGASEIGIITGCSTMTCLFVRPAIGMLTDKLAIRKTMLVLCCMTFGGIFFSLNFVPRRSVTSSTITNRSEELSVSLCSLHPSEISKKSVLNPVTHISCEPQLSLNTIDNDEKQERSVTFSCALNLSYFQSPIVCFYFILDNTPSNETLYYVTRFDDHDNAKSLDNNVTYWPVMISSLDHVIPPMLPSCVEECVDVSQSPQLSKEGDLMFINISLYDVNSPFGNVPVTNYVTPDFTFVLVFFLVMSFRVVYSSTTSLSDVIVYTLLGRNPHRWGRQRLWGSIGTVVVVLVNTAISIRYYQPNDASAVFPVCLVLSWLAGAVVAIKVKPGRIEKNKSLFLDIHTALANPAFRLLLCKLVFLGYMCGTAQNLVLWYIADIGGSHLSLGLTVACYGISSVVLLRFTGPLLKKIGYMCTLYLVMAAYVVRFLGLSFLHSPWAVLPFENLHGVTYSICWAAASGVTSQVSPPGGQATCHSISGALYWDLGRGLGAIASGQLFQLIGARWTFRTYAGLCGLAIPLMYAFDRAWPLPHLQTERKQKIEDSSAMIDKQDSNPQKKVESENNKFLPSNPPVACDTNQAVQFQ